MTFAEWLQRERERRGWNTTQMANATGVSQPLISMYEKGERKPKQATVLQIATALSAEVNTALIAAGYTPIQRETREPDPDMSLTIRRYSGLGKPRQQVVDKIVAALLVEEQAEYRTDANEETTTETDGGDNAPVSGRGDA